MVERIAASGEIDIASAPGLRHRLELAIEANPGGPVEVDFGAVTFVDSSGLGVLVAAQRRARVTGGDVSVTSLPAHLRTVFELTGLDKVLLAPAEIS